MNTRLQTHAQTTPVPSFTPVRTGLLQRKCACGGSPGVDGECAECRSKRLTVQRHTTNPAEPSTVPPIVHEVLRSPGQPPDQATRAFMEPRFGHDFSQVRVHTDARAAESARAVNALAYTVGQDVVFGAGQYVPRSHEGQRLLAHELVHVMQQGGQNNAQRTLWVGPVNDHYEQAADCVSTQVIQGGAAGRPLQTAHMGSASVLQRNDTGEDIKTVEWKAGVEMAEKAAKNPKTKATAADYYKELIVRAAQKVTAPNPLVDKQPTTSDIIWSWATTGAYGATTDPKKVDNAPNDYWKWLTFNPGAVLKEEAFTISVLLHELDHAAHAKALYDEWKKATTKKKESWDDFYLAHYKKWTEKEIKVKKPGIVGALAGLPEKIRPSAIEFRAYVNQFVNYFHKVSVDSQEWMGKAIILFYPLKIQKVEAKISDIALDLSKARKQILDYFKSPPVKNKSQQTIIKVRVTSVLKSALYLFRPPDDQAQIAADFKDIIDYSLSSDEKKEARKNYKPEAL